jgi:hypothetical protein
MTPRATIGGKRRLPPKVGCTANNSITILLRSRLNVVDHNRKRKWITPVATYGARWFVPAGLTREDGLHGASALLLSHKHPHKPERLRDTSSMAPTRIVECAHASTRSRRPRRDSSTAASPVRASFEDTTALIASRPRFSTRSRRPNALSYKTTLSRLT